MKEIKIKYAGKCIVCGKPIKKGSFGLWQRGIGIAHLTCGSGLVEQPKHDSLAEDGPCSSDYVSEFERNCADSYNDRY